MEKRYLLKRGSRMETVLSLTENVLGSYGLSLESGITSGNIKTIRTGGAKCGYVHFNGLNLTVDLILPAECGDEIYQNLERRLEGRRLLFSPSPIPQAPPIEIYTNGRKITSDSEKTAIGIIEAFRTPLEERKYRQKN